MVEGPGVAAKGNSADMADWRGELGCVGGTACASHMTKKASTSGITCRGQCMQLDDADSTARPCPLKGRALGDSSLRAALTLGAVPHSD